MRCRFSASSALSLADKVAISRGMMSFLQGVPADGGENFASWLARHGQTRRAIHRFWNPVLVSALNEDLDRVSVHYAAMVFRTSFIQSAQAGWMGVPTIPLSELYCTQSASCNRTADKLACATVSTALPMTSTPDVGDLDLKAAMSKRMLCVLAVPFESMQKLYPLLPPNPQGSS